MNFTRFTLCLSIFLVFSSFYLAQDIDSNIDSLNLVGHIAYVGNDSNVYTMDMSNAEIFQLTEDGTEQSSYEFPTWSIDGQLAYFCCSVRGFESPRLDVYISTNAVSPGKSFYSQEGERHIYAYWSPKTCESEQCGDLAVLIQDLSESRLNVELFNSQFTEGQRSLGEGLPFYYSWSSNGDHIVIHRNNNTLQYYSVKSADTISAFDDNLGSFLSPGWSPVDDRILFASSTDEETSDLTVINSLKQITLADNIEGLVSFSWSPNGQYVAYRVATSDSISSLYVIDSITGDIVARSNVSGVLSFFWSPDSTKLAYVTLSNPPGTFDINSQTTGNVAYLVQNVDGFAWNILSIIDSTNILSSSFIPTISMQYLFTNFDQFAQSHSVWSPDSQYIVYSERESLDSRNSMITIINTENTDIEPVHIAEGTFAIWSYK